MTPLERKFVIAYCAQIVADGAKPNATKAAIQAGYSENGADRVGSRLLGKIEIQEAIEERYQELAAAASLTVEKVLRLWMDIAYADPNELVQVRRICCRHCHGFDHQYQWTEAEYTAAVNRAVDNGKPAPDGLGGFGYDPKAAPHPECPECGGEGMEDIHLTDSRKLTGRARRLYAGVQRTKDGVKVLMRDQDAAAANLARYLGMAKDVKEISGPNGGPVQLSVSADDLTDEQLAAIIKGD